VNEQLESINHQELDAFLGNNRIELPDTVE
jgi:hypothetical protein